MKKFLRGLIVTALVSATVATSVFAAPSVNELKEEKQEAKNELASLENKMTSIMTKINKAEEELVSIGSKIGQAESDLAEAEELEKEQYEAMKHRIVAMYENGNTSMIALVLESGSIAEMLKQAENVQSVHEYDRKQLQEYVDTKEKIEKLKTSLEEDMESLEAKQESYEQEKQDLNNMIAEVKDEISDFDTKIQEAAAAAAAAAQQQQQQQQQQQRPGSNNSGNSSNSGSSNSSGSSNGNNSYGGSGNASVGQAIVNAAYSYIGTPYVWGGNGYGGIDCSGLTKAAHNAVGIYSIARTSGAQAGGGKNVGSLANALPGDVICYPGHVAIYIGNNTVIHAPTFGQTVKVANVSMGPSQPITAIRRYW